LGGDDDDQYVVYRTTPTFKMAVANPTCKEVLQITEVAEIESDGMHKNIQQTDKVTAWK